MKPEYKVSCSLQVMKLLEYLTDGGLLPWGEAIDIQKLPVDFHLKYHIAYKENLGAAHGLAGVYYVLLRAYEMNEQYLLKEAPVFVEKFLALLEVSVRFLLSCQHPSGNFPVEPSQQNIDADIVHWCHGSPGILPTLLLAKKIFSNEDLKKLCFESAQRSANYVWKYGIVKKGNGLCHGISGNAYSFLNMFKETKEEVWRYRATCFATTYLDTHYSSIIDNYDEEDRLVKGKSDYPYSFSVGLIGDILFQLHILAPELSRFPGYEV